MLRVRSFYFLNYQVISIKDLFSCLFLGFLARYRPDLQDRGTVKGTQTGISGTILYILIQILEKKMTYLPVSAVIPPPGG